MNTVTQIQLIDPLIERFNISGGTNVKGYLDISEETLAPLTFSVSDVRDLAQRNGVFSKSIKIRGTKNNNKIFNYYFDVNLLVEENVISQLINYNAATWDINRIVYCNLIQNGVLILEKAIIQLVSVTKKQETNLYDDELEYTVLIKDTSSDFFSIINQKYLEDCELNLPNMPLTISGITNSFKNTISQGFKFIMGYVGGTSGENYATANDNIVNIEEFKPAIFAKKYFDAIFADAGYTYKWESIDDDTIRFSKLIIPFNGDEPKTDATQISGLTSVTLNNPTIGQDVYTKFKQTSSRNNLGGSRTVPKLITGEPVKLDLNGSGGFFDPVTDTFTVPAGVDSNSSNVSFKIKYDIDFFVNNQYNVPMKIVNSYNPSNSTGSLGLKPMIRLVKNNSEVVDAQPLLTFKTFNAGTIGNYLAGGSPNSRQLLAPESGNTVTLKSKTLITGDQYKIECYLEANTNGNVKRDLLGFIGIKPVQSEVAWFFARASDTDVEFENSRYGFTIKNLSIDYDQNLDTSYGNNAVVIFNDFIPKKIKQSDFLKSIAIMFNLYFETDRDNKRQINIFKRDNYYDSGNVIDWTLKLDKGTEQELKFLPELQNKQLLLTYKQDSDWANETYFNAVGEIYSQYLFTFNNEYVKGVDKKELIFSPTPIFYQESLNATLPMINGISPKCNIRILYDGGETPCNQYAIKAVGQSANQTDQTVTATTYPLAIHWDKAKKGSYSIEFGTDDYYFLTNYNDDAPQNNLSYMHWRRTLDSINKGRLFTGYFFLTENDIANLRLNSTVLVNNHYWYINKIIDYEATANKTTKVELKSIEDKVTAPIFPRQPLEFKRGSFPFENLVNNLNLIRIGGLNDGAGIGPGSWGIGNILVGDNNRLISLVGSNNNLTGNANIFGDENTISTPTTGFHTVVGNGNFLASNRGTIFGNNNSLEQGSDLAFIWGDRNLFLSGSENNRVWGFDNINSGATGTTIFGDNNIIASGLSNVHLFGSNFTATTSNTSFFDNIRISSGSTINDIPIQAYMGGVNDTGVIQFTGATITLPDKINIPPVDAWFVDNETDPLNPTKERIHYSGVTGLTIPTISGGSASYILLRKDGTLLFQNNFPTSPDRKTHCFLGKVGHPNGVISVGLNVPDVATSPNAQLRDLWKGIGFINRNVSVVPISGLTVGRSAGTLFGNGVGYIFNPKSASEFFVSAQTQSSLVYRTQTGGTFTGVTQLNPGFYDVGGVVTPVGGGANSSTLQYCFAVPNSNQFLMQYGQVVYTNLTDAIAAVGKEPFILLPSLVDNSILIGIIAINKNATNVNDPTQVRFFSSDIFGQIVGAAGGTPTTNLQGAYNNSSNPEIITNSTLQAINIRAWSDTNTIMEFQDTTGGTITTISAKDAIINGLTVGRGGGNNLFNTAFGLNALSANTSGTANTAIGRNALNAETTAFGNVGVGHQALQFLTSGTSNTAVGTNAMGQNVTGNTNVAMGNTALFQQLGNDNVGIGTSAIANLPNGSGNTAVGTASLLGLQGTAILNTALGFDAGRFVVGSGATQNGSINNSIFIGAGTRGQSGTTNAIVIGTNANGLGANNTVIGTTATTASTIYGLVTSNGFKTFTGTSQQSLQADGSTLVVTGGTYLPVISGETNITGGVIINNNAATFTQIGNIVTVNIGFFFTPTASGNTRFVASLPVNKTNFATQNAGSGSANDNVNSNIRSTVFGQVNAPNNINVSLFVTSASGNQWVANVGFQYNLLT